MTRLRQAEWRFVLVNAVFGLFTAGVTLLLAMTMWGAAVAGEATGALALAGHGVPGWWLVVILIIALPITYSVALDWAFGAFRKTSEPEEEYY